ncbi:MAG: MerR family transcriptional regulator [Thermodesulfobacteriota bacterium]
MKISELVKRTQVSKETIHYYIREGLLPRPRKLGKNVADYGDSYVERIRLIKEFQDHRFLPLSVIKRVLKYKKGSPERESFLQLHTDYFRPVDQLLPTEIVGEEAFRKETGLGRRWLAKMEEWGIITPEIRDGRKIYSHDDVTLGRVVVDMDRIGLGPKDGFDPEALKHYRDAFLQIVVMAQSYFMRAVGEKLSSTELLQLGVQAREIMSVFFYHLFRKLARQEHERDLRVMKSKKKENEMEQR